MALWNDDPAEFDDPDERPYGWGLCCQCGTDCEEDDYDDGKQQSTCPTCRERQAQSLDEHVEVFARR